MLFFPNLFLCPFLSVGACVRVSIIFSHVGVIGHGLAQSAETGGPLRPRALESPVWTFEAVSSFRRGARQKHAIRTYRLGSNEWPLAAVKPLRSPASYINMETRRSQLVPVSSHTGLARLFVAWEIWREIYPWVLGGFGGSHWYLVLDGESQAGLYIAVYGAAAESNLLHSYAY